MAVPKVTGFRANGRRVQAQKAQILLRSEFVTFLSDFSGTQAACFQHHSARENEKPQTLRMARGGLGGREAAGAQPRDGLPSAAAVPIERQIGRASCRERVEIA